VAQLGCPDTTAGDSGVREDLIAKRDALVANYGKQRDALLADLLPEAGPHENRGVLRLVCAWLCLDRICHPASMFVLHCLQSLFRSGLCSALALTEPNCSVVSTAHVEPPRNLHFQLAVAVQACLVGDRTTPPHILAIWVAVGPPCIGHPVLPALHTGPAAAGGLQRGVAGRLRGAAVRLRPRHEHGGAEQPGPGRRPPARPRRRRCRLTCTSHLGKVNVLQPVSGQQYGKLQHRCMLAGILPAIAGAARCTAANSSHDAAIAGFIGAFVVLR
jgi:hypothetical protein